MSGPAEFPFRRRALCFHGSRLHVASGWEVALDKAGIAADRDWSVISPGEAVTHSPITNCFRVPLDTGASVYFKRYVYRIRRPQFHYPLPSKAAVENFGYHRFRELGIPCPEVIAVGEMRRFGVLHAACIITRAIPDCLELERFAGEVWYPMPEPLRTRTGREIAHRILDQAVTAHQASLFHHDLKWRNILIRKTAEGYTPVWIDCPRAAVMRLRRRRGMLVDLGGLARLALSYLSIYERYRLLGYYLQRMNCGITTRDMFKRIDDYLARRPPGILDLPPDPG